MAAHDAPVTLVIQLGSEEILFQNLMALRAVKQLYPMAEFHLLVDSRWVKALEKVQWIESVIAFPRHVFLGDGLPSATSVQELAQWLSPIVRQQWDFVVNWTYTGSSAYLAALIPASVRLGYARRKDSALMCSDDWSTYLLGLLSNSRHQNIHMIDILTTQLLTAFQMNVGEPAAKGDEAVTSKMFFQIEDSWAKRFGVIHGSLKKWITLELGLRGGPSAWTPKQSAEFAVGILKKHADFNLCLLCENRENPGVSEFLNHLDAAGVNETRIAIVDHASGFDSVASAIRNAHWVITSDQRTCHLAAVLGTRILFAASERVQCVARGPYGNGHIGVAPRTKDTSIEPGHILAVLEYAFQERFHQRMLSIEEFSHKAGFSVDFEPVHCCRSRIRPSVEGGGVVYESLHHRPIEIDEWVQVVLGQVARQWYCGWIAPTGQGLDRKALSPSLLNRLRAMDLIVGEFIRYCQRACALAVFIAEKTRFLKSDKVMSLENYRDIRNLADEISKVDLLVNDIAIREPAMQGLVSMYNAMLHNVHGTKLTEISRSSADTYRKFQEALLLIKTWIAKTIEMAKPVAIPLGINREKGMNA